MLDGALPATWDATRAGQSPLRASGATLATGLVVNRRSSTRPASNDRWSHDVLALRGRGAAVRHDGVLLPLRLTNAVLADLVAARRPTVTSALSELARRGTGTRRRRGLADLGNNTRKANQASRRRIRPTERTATRARAASREDRSLHSLGSAISACWSGDRRRWRCADDSRC